MSSMKRVFELLDYVDQFGEFSAEDLIRKGHSRSNTYRQLAYLTDHGLLSRRRAGEGQRVYYIYGAGPRYRRQEPGTDYSRAGLRRQQVQQILALRAKRVSCAAIARMLGLGYSTVRKIADANRQG